jgi:hypothetical protein
MTTTPVVGVVPVTADMASVAYPDAARLFAGKPHILPFWKVKNDFVYRAWPLEAVSILKKSMLSAPLDSRVSLSPLGGAFAQVSPTATAFPWRHARFWLLASTYWIPTDSDDIDRVHLQWIETLFKELSPFLSNAVYVNQMDANLGHDYLQAYYGPNVNRLRDVKTQVDPTNVFKFPQSIPPFLSVVV